MRVIVALVPMARRDSVRIVLGELGSELTYWLYGRLIAMAFVGVFVGVGLAVMKVPMALPLGLLAGVLTFIEYLGAVASAAPAMLLAFTKSPMLALAVAGLFTVVHIIEGYMLTPLLARRMVHLAPGYTLATQVILGSIFGVAGLTSRRRCSSSRRSSSEALRRGRARRSHGRRGPHAVAVTDVSDHGRNAANGDSS